MIPVQRARPGHDGVIRLDDPAPARDEALGLRLEPDHRYGQPRAPDQLGDFVEADAAQSLGRPVLQPVA